MNRRRARVLEQSPCGSRLGGLTLIELMVALAVFAILGTLTYRGTVNMLDGREQVERELERWREIGRALHIIETELLQVVAPALPPGAQRPPALRLHTLDDGSELVFLGLAGGSHPERIGFRHSGDLLEWVRHPEGRPDQTERDILLTEVTAVRWQFVDQQDWIAHWPPAEADADRLPPGVRIELDLPAIGTLTRIHALR